MPLSSDERALVDSLRRSLAATEQTDRKLLAYYQGSQRLEQLGMSVPPKMQRFVVIADWPGVVVDGIESRQDVRQLIMPGEEIPDPVLRELWDANNLESDLSLFNLDRLIYGRGFLSVGTNEDDRERPLIHVESPREMSALVDTRRRRMVAAGRFLKPAEDGEPTELTLYMPDQTVWARRDESGRWVDEDRDRHNLGRVPVTMSLNGRRSGSWQGTSAMSRVMGLTDAAARSLTNLQFAQEAHGVPQRFALGVSEGDFVDAQGNPIPRWEAYFNAVWANKNPNVKVGQFTQADLKNFDTAVNLYGRLAASVTGFPAKYFGLFTTNPAGEGAIRAEESQMVKGVERHNAQVGSVLGWTMALAWRFRTGDWIDGNRVRVEWHDPATPTFAQRADALQKLAGGKPLISREGAWDELGWSEARKSKERAYLESEAEDPAFESALRAFAAGEPSNAAAEQ